MKVHLLVLIGILLCMAWPASYGDTTVKVWHFSSRSGPVAIEMFTYSGNEKGIGIYIEPRDKIGPSAADESKMLEKVLSEVPALGYKPSELLLITTPLSQSEYHDGVSNAVQISGLWKKCIYTKYCYPASPAANRYLKKIHAFAPFNRVLRRYGMSVKSATVDDLVCSYDPDNFDCGAMIDIELSRK